MTVTVLAWAITTAVWVALWIAVPLPPADGAAGFLFAFVCLYFAVLHHRRREAERREAERRSAGRAR